METTLQPVTDRSFGDVPPGMGAMAVMGKEGDTKYIWDKTKTDEVDVARQTFNTFTKTKKYRAFKVVGDGSKGEQADEFDPNEQRYIFVPPLQGG